MYTHQFTIGPALLAAIFGPGAGQPDPAVNDASLHAVFFVDHQTGWAAGDRGVIWQTGDGGRHWQLQTSGANCALRSLWFLDGQVGWAAGGQGLPYSPASSGLVLATGDGGRSWRPVSWGRLPRLHGIRFWDRRTGLAWGEGSAVFPSGLFRTATAGQRWHPGAGAGPGGWLAAAFWQADRGILAGPGRGLVKLDRQTGRPVPGTSLLTRTVRDLTRSRDGLLWAVGDGALVLRSDQGGTNWRAVSLPADYRRIFDWRAVATADGQVWIAGRPGSVVLHSEDGGRSWHRLPTGVTVPLHDLWFVDHRRGWAVGALGTVLATSDGGRSWQVQRRGGQRAAALLVHSTPDHAELLTHVQLGAEEGYLCADLNVVGPTDDQTGRRADALAARLADAVCLAGGTETDSDWRFPETPAALSADQVLRRWNRRLEGRALEELEARLVLAIRIWRPEVIVGQGPAGDESADPAGALVDRVLGRAFERAGDPEAFPQQLKLARLAPWSPKRLWVRADDRADAEAVVLDAERFSRVTAGPLDDRLRLATALLARSYRATYRTVAYRSQADRLRSSHTGGGLMGGIVLVPGGPARRQLPPPTEMTDAGIKAEQARRNLRALIQRAETNPLWAAQLDARLDAWLDQMRPDQAANMLWDLAGTHARHGRWDQARQLLEKLCTDFPRHVTTAEACRWLIQFYASSEARHRQHLASAVVRQVVEPGAGRLAGGECKAGRRAVEGG